MSITLANRKRLW